VTKGALLLTPSRGLGGGIERYVETVEWAFDARGIKYQRLDLYRPANVGRAVAYARLLHDARKYLRADEKPTRVIVAHRSLLPAALLLRREGNVSGISVVCHGTEVWGDRAAWRKVTENRLIRNRGVRAIAVSSFTAGALIGNCPASVLSPGLTSDWFRTLVGASENCRKTQQGIHIVTAFRLDDYRGKGLPEIVRAIAMLGRKDVRLTVCGSGDPSAELQSLLQKYPFTDLYSRLSDAELARQFAVAHLFILATRTRPGRDPSGEGFGLVLLEAQVAGTPVIGPASGGAYDAYIEQVTGMTPADESSEALATSINNVLEDPSRLSEMGKRAAEWSRELFNPDSYASRVVERLL